MTRPTSSPPTRSPRRGRPKGSTTTTGDALGAIHAEEAYPLREMCRRLGLGPKGWRTLRNTGLPVRIVGRQRFVLGRDLIDHLASLPVEGDSTN